MKRLKDESHEIYMYIYMYVCTYICMYTHTNTHIFICIQFHEEHTGYYLKLGNFEVRTFQNWCNTWASESGRQ